MRVPTIHFDAFVALSVQAFQTPFLGTFSTIGISHFQDSSLMHYMRDFAPEASTRYSYKKLCHLWLRSIALLNAIGVSLECSYDPMIGSALLLSFAQKPRHYPENEPLCATASRL